MRLEKIRQKTKTLRALQTPLTAFLCNLSDTGVIDLDSYVIPPSPPSHWLIPFIRLIDN